MFTKAEVTSRLYAKEFPTFHTARESHSTLVLDADQARVNTVDDTFGISVSDTTPKHEEEQTESNSGAHEQLVYRYDANAGRPVLSVVTEPIPEIVLDHKGTIIGRNISSPRPDQVIQAQEQAVPTHTVRPRIVRPGSAEERINIALARRDASQAELSKVPTQQRTSEPNANWSTIRNIFVHKPRIAFGRLAAALR